MYFESEGSKNTKKTVELAIAAAKERKIRYIVVASNSGNTARLFKDIKDCGIVCVTHASGFAEKGKNEMQDSIRSELLKMGFKVLTTTHVLSGAERGLSKKFGGINPVEIIANTLRMFGQGVKVCVEISVMALDAGLIPYGEPVIAIGGTEGGADTCIVLQSAHANSILETRIREIICKPL